MKLLAFGDVHSPEYLPILTSSLKRTKLDSVQLVLIAGDVVKRGDYRMCAPVEKTLRNYLPNVEIVAVFGNEDYPEVRDKMRDECTEIRWLDDEYVRLSLILETIVLGTTGVLDRPTRWQLKNVPEIVKIYNERIIWLSRLLESLPQGKLTLLLTHYPPRSKTLTGEPPEAWDEMSSRRLTEVLIHRPVDVVVHGHLHYSVVHRDVIGSVPVYNVALPATRNVSIIDLKPTGLTQWLSY
ncbi:MAG: metallophosphoesterase family protein [Infirmifilum sp.]|uniref:metallophosphoesterase family protein n=1 Tax=Infirmifilum TaxID=2856573 RepID=UPI0023544E29